MPPTNQQKLPEGAIVACPVSRCELRHVSGVGVLMVIHYIDKSEQLESGERTTLQAILVPEQAAEIGEALQKSVKALEMGKALRSSIKLLKASNSLEPAMAEPVSA